MEIINSKNVTDDQISLLKKGFEFVPSRKKVEFTQLITDLQTWELRIRFREYCIDKKRDFSLQDV